MSFFVVISIFETEKLNPERISNSASKYTGEWGFQSSGLTPDPWFLTTALFCLSQALIFKARDCLECKKSEEASVGGTE